MDTNRDKSDPLEMRPQGTQQPLAAPGHETSDASVWPVFVTGLVLLGVVMLITIAVYVMWVFYERSIARSDQQPVTREAVQVVLPPAPRLQLSPPRDMDQMLAQQNAWLNSYGWVNRERGVVHIPIRQAMALVVERETTATIENRSTSAGLTVAHDPSSGQVLEEVVR